MKHFIRLTDYSVSDMHNVFAIARGLAAGVQNTALKGKTVILFFPHSSIRTRVTFEKGIYLLGGQSVLFPSDTLDKKESHEDVAGYLNNWADCVVIRHNRLDLLEQFAGHSAAPVINAMTAENHPCEVLSDLFAIAQKRSDYLSLNYTFVGAGGNIAKAWAEAAAAFGIGFVHCCPRGYEMENVIAEHDMNRAMQQSDVVITDSVPAQYLNDFMPYQVTAERMSRARPGALLNPCPPFTRGEEVSADAIGSNYFVGYGFKQALLYMQQALMIYGIHGQSA